MCMLAHSRVSLPNNTYGWLLAQLSNNTETSKSKRNDSYAYGFFVVCFYYFEILHLIEFWKMEGILVMKKCYAMEIILFYSLHQFDVKLIPG